MATYLDAYRKGETAVYSPRVETLNLGTRVLPVIERPAEDRNRTSPFPYGGTLQVNDVA